MTLRTQRFIAYALEAVLVASFSFLAMRLGPSTERPSAFLGWFVALAVGVVLLRFAIGFWKAATLEDQARKLRIAMTLANDRAKHEPSGSVKFYQREPIDLGVTMTAAEDGRMALLMFATREPSRGLFVILEPRHMPALSAAIQSIGPNKVTRQ